MSAAIQPRVSGSALSAKQRLRQRMRAVAEHAVLHQLRDAGNTIFIIEHNLDVIKTADWLIDIGPEGGAVGGTVVEVGLPEDLAANSASHTGRYLAPLLAQRNFYVNYPLIKGQHSALLKY